MYRKTLIAAALLAAIAGAAVAAPQSSTDTTRPARVKLDANSDGVIDKAEAAKHPRLADKFAELDKNSDGKLSADERPSGRHGRDGDRGSKPGGIERMDTDGDGRISRAEFDTAKTARDARKADKAGAEAGKPRHGRTLDFAAVDTNRDGYLVRSELRSYHERMRPQMEAEFAKRSAEQFAAADINKDGKLSKLEVSEKMPRLNESFAWMDENRDGFISQQELKPAPRR